MGFVFESQKSLGGKVGDEAEEHLSQQRGAGSEAARAGLPAPLFPVRHIIMATGNTASWPEVRPGPVLQASSNRANLGNDFSASSHMTHLYRPLSGLSATRNPIQTTSANSCSETSKPLGLLRRIPCNVRLRAGLLTLLVSSVSRAA